MMQLRTIGESITNDKNVEYYDKNADGFFGGSITADNVIGIAL